MEQMILTGSQAGHEHDVTKGKTYEIPDGCVFKDDKGNLRSVMPHAWKPAPAPIGKPDEHEMLTFHELGDHNDSSN